MTPLEEYLTKELNAANARNAEQEKKTKAAFNGLLASLRLDAGEYPPEVAIQSDIDRLLDLEQRWLNACALARTHCPVSTGESYIFSGIPKLAAKLEAALAREEQLEKEISALKAQSVTVKVTETQHLPMHSCETCGWADEDQTHVCNRCTDGLTARAPFPKWKPIT